MGVRFAACSLEGGECITSRRIFDVFHLTSDATIRIVVASGLLLLLLQKIVRQTLSDEIAHRRGVRRSPFSPMDRLFLAVLVAPWGIASMRAQQIGTFTPLSLILVV